MKEKQSAKAEMKQLMADLAKTLKEHNSQALPKVKKAAKTTVKRKTSPKKADDYASRIAQEMMYDAWEEGAKSERVRMAKRALIIDPDCADAWSLLANDAAKSLDQAIEYYEKGVSAGRRTIGEKKFKDYAGDFWGFLDTRPYMRARAGLMMTLWLAGKEDEAIDHARAMLELNPNDNQGIRYRLISYLAASGRWTELETLLTKSLYKNDCMAEWIYTRVLFSFVKKGNGAISARELKKALTVNRHVPDYLLGRKPVPRRLPDRIIFGGEDEAFCYASENIDTWRKTPGALDWLEFQMDQSGILKKKPGRK